MLLFGTPGIVTMFSVMAAKGRMGGTLRDAFRRMNNTENLFGTPGFIIMFFVMAGNTAF